MAGMVIVAHKGIPCTPPLVDGVAFQSLGEDDLWVAECTEEQAADFTRNPAYKRYGGAVALGGRSQAELDAEAAAKAADEAAAKEAAEKAETEAKAAADAAAAKEAEAAAAADRERQAAEAEAAAAAAAKRGGK